MAACLTYVSHVSKSFFILSINVFLNAGVYVLFVKASTETYKTQETDAEVIV